MRALRSTLSFELFGVSSPFDPDFRLVTSPVLSPAVLGALRLLFAVYALTTTIVTLVFSSLVLHTADSYFSYFTDLSYIGLVAYFWASSVQTIAFVLRGRKSYPLQSWPRVLQLLHVLLHSTVVVYPIIVTVVFWALLASSGAFQSPYASWVNISHHAMNSGFALFEIFLTHAGPSPWIHLLPLLLILASYLGVAYITHATQGIYTYSFLDPAREGSLLAAYIVGIAIGCCLLFSIVKGISHLRQRLSYRHGWFEQDRAGAEELEEWQGVEMPVPRDSFPSKA